ncbi:hypothetical protein [uncultured Litoreibacter sp.]|uniref:hypothetical protein n=1 Tax=uncultured Litoreibacter sp. TaxID=1392394 RepID=UPI0026384A74|nr:hypothetical protein [uncultured Litoreibacter sp.]
MRLFAAVVFFLALGSAVSAQPLGSVRSGEHDGFSRLVVYLSENITWAFERSEDSYILTVPNWTAGFDATAVFERLRRDRVVEVNSDDSSLRLVLGCDCTATATAFGPNAVIIDVIDVPAETEKLAQREIIRLPTDLPARASTSDLPLPQDIPDASNLGELDAFRQSLLESVSGSTALNLLQLDDAQPIPDQSAEQIAIGAMDAAGQFQVTTAIEEAQLRAGLGVQPPPPADCPDPRNFDILSWGQGEDFSNQLSQLRQNTFGEFDTPNGPQILRLAQLYLYFGLGAEAQMVREVFGLDGPSWEAIHNISRLLEPSKASAGSMLSNMKGCDPLLAPWTLLDLADGSVASDKLTKDTVSQFSKWPHHLQVLLGPRLISLLARSGQDDAAGVIQSILSRHEGGATSALTLTIARESETETVSQDALWAVVKEDGADAPEALHLYMLAQLDDRVDVEAHVLELSAAFEQELEGTPVAVSLSRARVLALAQKGLTKDALDLLRRVETGEENATDELLDDLVERVLNTGRAKDLMQVAHHLLREDSAGNVDSEDLERLARGLLEFGLPEAASKLLGGARSTPKSTILEADIAIALGNLDDADAILANIASAQANLKRADQLLRQGDDTSAWNVLSEEHPEEQRSDIAWAASEWQSVTLDGPKKQVAEMIGETSDVSLEDRPLATALDFQKASEQSREAIRRLLAEGAL